MTAVRVGLDGVVYQWSAHGGVAQTYDELVPRMAASDPNLEMTIFLDGPLRRIVPSSSRVSARFCPPLPRYLRPHRILSRYEDRAHALAYSVASRRERLDLWHATYFNVPAGCRAKLVVANYDMIHWLFPEFFPGPVAQALRRQQQRALLAADHIVTNSEATRSDTIRLLAIDPERITAAPIACGQSYRVLEGASPLWAPAVLRLLAERREYLLYVGARGGHKDFRTLVGAVASCRDLDQLLVLVGPPLEADDKALLERSGLTSRVRPLGRVDDESLAGLYNHAAAFVHTSLYEGFGIPLLEAMACRCPIVASRIPSTLEVAADCAVYFEPGDQASAASAIMAVVDSQGTDSRVSDGMARAACFSWKRCAEGTLRIYRDLIG